MKCQLDPSNFFYFLFFTWNGTCYTHISQDCADCKSPYQILFKSSYLAADLVKICNGHESKIFLYKKE